MDVGAFTELVRTHQAAVAAVAYAVVRDRALAHDLTQEAFVTAWRRIDEVREPERTGAWLCGIVRFLARDHRRVERRRQALRERHADAAPAVSPTPTPLERALSREDEALLAAAVADLPESQREPLLLHYVANLSISEIAQALALAEDAVKQRLSRARAALRDEARFASAALALAPLPSFTAATVRAATSAAPSTPPVPTQESIMSSHPILTASLLAGALAAGGLAVAATRGDDSSSTTARMRDTNAADSAVLVAAPPAVAPPARARPDRSALLAQIRAARARGSTITAIGGGTGAMPPQTRPMVYDFSGETLTAGLTPKPPSTKAYTVLDKSAIRASLDGARADVLACYESALTRAPSLAGTLTVRIVIEGEPDIGGMISDASILAESSTLRDASLETCILDAIVAIDLPAPAEGTEVTVHYPYTFAPH
ncbi:MAG TPA: sigma-70 family RNA polymerase sigma factor [Kofleriaceae bacterium]|nr:sigma-70 family RNA polymerase sigma factor [Kofleriaceae bacterium]